MPIKKTPLARKNPNNPQIKSYADAVKSGQKNYHVLSDGDSWKIQRIGRSAQDGRFRVKEEAIKKAMVLARKERGEVIIHKKDGLIQNRRSFRK